MNRQLASPWMFQFTHPVRGATPRRGSPPRGGRVSIHAPRAGCDRARPARRGRQDVSIHAPRAGCDSEFLYGVAATVSVSIHAPRAGCDSSKASVLSPTSLFQFTHPVRGATHNAYRRVSRPRCFNSRTPCGVRLVSARLSASAAVFQFTHPVRGATSLLSSLFTRSTVSIHAPRAGCDIAIEIKSVVENRFNSRTPCGVRLGGLSCLGVKDGFQFTHPVRGATRPTQGAARPRRVSIHAPRAGCDSTWLRRPPISCKFQFTHPVRGATRRC